MSNGNFNPPNHTVLVPRPGATLVPQANQGNQPAQTGSGNTQIPHGYRPQPQTFKPGGAAEASPTSLTSAALTLLSLMATLQTTPNHDNVPTLHKHITQEIKNFENNAMQTGAGQETVLAARYLMCSALDEIVLNTPWGSQSGWSQHSLLSLFHKETSGGEKSFAILNKMLTAAGQNLEILELFFHCFSLGFMGKYRFNPRGAAELEQIKDNLYATIKGLSPSFETDLSPHWQADGSHKPGLTSHIPLWVMGCVSLAILVLSFAGFRYWLHQSSAPVTTLIESHIDAENKTPKSSP